jgi:uncharacterized membrane protein YhaH (DUF805 family)
MFILWTSFWSVVGFQVLTMATMIRMVFWVVALYSLEKVWGITGTRSMQKAVCPICCFLPWLTLSSWRLRQYSLPYVWLFPNYMVIQSRRLYYFIWSSKELVLWNFRTKSLHVLLLLITETTCPAQCGNPMGFHIGGTSHLAALKIPSGPLHIQQT